MKKMRHVRKLILYNWELLVGFELIYKLATALVFVPLFWGLFNIIMKVSGYAYLTAENIGAFIANPITIFMMLCLFVLLTTYAMIDISAVVYTLDCSAQKKPIRFLHVLAFSLKNAMRAWNPKNILMIVVVLLLMPFLNIGMASSFLTTIAVPEFIMDYINANKLLNVLFVSATVLLAALMMRWLYSFHYFTLEGCSFGEACKKSANLSRGRRLRDFFYMLLMQTMFTVVYILFILITVALSVMLGRIFSNIFILKWIASTFVWIVFAVSVAIISMLALPFSYACVSAFYYQHKDEKGEEILHGAVSEDGGDKRKNMFIRRLCMTACFTAVLGGLAIGYLYYSGNLNLKIEYIRMVEITAHRGASAFYPENTMSAFEGAKRMGADWIELDVQQTKDGEIIVIHDSNLNRTTGVNSPVWELTYEKISELDAGSFFGKEFAGEKIPLLTDVIEFAKENNINLNIELKPTGHERDFEKCVIDIIKQAEFEDDCVVTSQVYDVLEKLKAYDPTITTVYVTSVAYGDINRMTAADHFSIEASSVTKNLVSNIHNSGKEIYVWTVNTEENINKMIRLGVDNIITDDVVLAKDCVYESRYSDLLSEYIRLFQR